MALSSQRQLLFLLSPSPTASLSPSLLLSATPSCFLFISHLSVSGPAITVQPLSYIAAAASASSPSVSSHCLSSSSALLPSLRLFRLPSTTPTPLQPRPFLSSFHVACSAAHAAVFISSLLSVPAHLQPQPSVTLGPLHLHRLVTAAFTATTFSSSRLPLTIVNSLPLHAIILHARCLPLPSSPHTQPFFAATASPSQPSAFSFLSRPSLLPISQLHACTVPSCWMQLLLTLVLDDLMHGVFCMEFCCLCMLHRHLAFLSSLQ